MSYQPPPLGWGGQPPKKSRVGLIVGVVAMVILLGVGIGAGAALFANSGDHTTKGETSSIAETATDTPPSTAAPVTGPTHTAPEGDVAFAYPDTFRGLTINTDPGMTQQQATFSEYRSSAVYEGGAFTMFQWYPDRSIANGDYDTIQYKNRKGPPDKQGEGVCITNDFGEELHPFYCVLDVHGGSMTLGNNENLKTYETVMAALQEMVDTVS